jgi:hypothetical protein
MADITYTRTYAHNDWVDNEDVVQAGGEKGFNQEFHGLEAELDKISTTFGATNTAIQSIQRLTFLTSQAPTNLAANSSSPEIPVETYDRSTLQPNVERIYFAVILPVSGATNVLHTFLYRQVPGNKMAVSIQFFNPTATPANFAFRVLAFALP